MTSRLKPKSLSPIRWLTILAVVAVVFVGAASLPGAVWDRVGDAISKLNPFDEKTIDKTGPSVLISLKSLSEFKAASAYFETVIDLKKDTNNLPGFISGERVLYVGKGDVEAVVDFSELDERRVVLSSDGTSVTVNLPTPKISEPRLNLKTSYLADRDEGIINRFRGSDLERDAQLKAVAQMTEAATGANNLTALAKESTTTMLRGLFGALGYTDITVTFGARAAGNTP